MIYITFTAQHVTYSSITLQYYLLIYEKTASSPNYSTLIHALCMQLTMLDPHLFTVDLLPDHIQVLQSLVRMRSKLTKTPLLIQGLKKTEL